MTRRWARSMVAAAVAVGGSLFATAPATAQEASTQPLVQQLTTLMDQRKLDSMAARDPGSTDRYIAALYIQGSQLLVVGAQYSVPTLLNEKLHQQKYMDVYIDLNAATDPATKVLVEDLQANGLRPDRDDDQPFDIYTKPGGDRVPFDGEWRKHKMSETEYRQMFADAEKRYSHMLEVLIGELKKADIQ